MGAKTRSDKRELRRLVRGLKCLVGDWHNSGQDKADVPCKCWNYMRYYTFL